MGWALKVFNVERISVISNTNIMKKSGHFYLTVSIS